MTKYIQKTSRQYPIEGDNYHIGNMHFDWKGEQITRLDTYYTIQALERLVSFLAAENLDEAAITIDVWWREEPERGLREVVAGATIFCKAGDS